MVNILNFGSLNVDTVYSVTHIARPGETIAAAEVSSFCGGKGFNQSIALARAGSTLYHAGKIGSDGSELQHQLLLNGVDCSFLLSSAGESGNAIIQCAASGENAIILYAGANREITCQEIDTVLAHFTSGDILVSQNEISNVPYLLQRAAKMGMKIALNPSPMDKSMCGLPLDEITWLLINEIEGEELTCEKEPQKITDLLISRHPNLAIVLTLGDHGAVYADKNCLYKTAVFKVPVVDTTGAGDTFLGYFISMVSCPDCDIPSALKTASAAAALSVSVAGALPSIPKAVDVRAFLAQQQEMNV